MLIGIFSDPHITKSIGELTSKFQEYHLPAFRDMYKKFKEVGCDIVVCCGDLLDAPRIDAHQLAHLYKLLGCINIETHIVLGNHEAVKDGTHILDILGDKMIVEDKPRTDGDLVYLPYNYNLYSKDIDFTDKIVFSHHDVYHNNIPGGIEWRQTELTKAKYVFNGHVHESGYVTDRIVNLGALFEMAFSPYADNRERPMLYWTYDTDADILTAYENKHTMHFTTIYTVNDPIPYPKEDTVLRLKYKGSEPSTSALTGFLRVKLQKDVKSESVNDSKEIIRKSVDINELIDMYVDGMDTSYKDDVKRIAKEVVKECNSSN